MKFIIAMVCGCVVGIYAEHHLGSWLGYQIVPMPQQISSR